MQKPVSIIFIAKYSSQLIITKSREYVTMTGLQEDRRSYSTLEWLGSDGTAGVPQALGPAVTVGFDNTPELDGTASAPEVSNCMTTQTTLTGDRCASEQAHRSSTALCLQKLSIL